VPGNRSSVRPPRELGSLTESELGEIDRETLQMLQEDAGNSSSGEIPAVVSVEELVTGS
jgi:hypothetical protein